MKKIFVVIDGKDARGERFIFAETIRAGENIKVFVDRWRCDILHLCESRAAAEQLAAEWNAAREAKKQ